MGRGLRTLQRVYRRADGTTRSDREIGARGLITASKTNRQSARGPTAGHSTDKTFVQRITRKLGVSDRTRAAVRALGPGLPHDRK